MYSNGMGEVVLGNAIKKLGLPREEIVVLTKVRPHVSEMHRLGYIRSTRSAIRSAKHWT